MARLSAYVASLELIDGKNHRCILSVAMSVDMALWRGNVTVALVLENGETAVHREDSLAVLSEGVAWDV